MIDNDSVRSLVGAVAEEVDVCVVVVNFNTSNYLRICLSSLLEQRPAMVVVVDNGSQEGEVDIVRDLLVGVERCRLLALDVNVGFGAAVNAGVKLAREEAQHGFYWILNPDTEILGHCLPRLVASANLNQADIVSPIILTGDRENPDISYAGGSLDLARGSSSHCATVTKVNFGGFFQCSFVTGAAMLIASESWSRMGGFREDLFMYWEDADLCARASVGGMRMGLAIDALVWHRVGGANGSSGMSPLYYYAMHRNRLIISTRPLDVAFGRGLLNTMRLFKDAVLDGDGRAVKLRACLDGLCDGLLGRSFRNAYI